MLVYQIRVGYFRSGLLQIRVGYFRGGLLQIRVGYFSGGLLRCKARGLGSRAVGYFRMGYFRVTSCHRLRWVTSGPRHTDTDANAYVNA